MQNGKQTSQKIQSDKYPPVVAVLGHVDHGKTSLLDAVRKTSFAEREIGGITQKIGASSIELIHEGQKRKITFIDTPGHAAFSQMRGRGARVADIALLVIAASEGLKPQTIESIETLKKSQTRFIVVFTKSDLPHLNTPNIKRDLLKQQVSLEEFGGDVPAIEVSAKTGLNIKELLDLIILVFDLHDTREDKEKTSPNEHLKAIVIESKLDPKAGPRATVVIKNGTLRVRDEVHTDGIEGKIRSILSTKGQSLKEATIGDAVEILGIEKVPAVGSVITHKSNTLALKAQQEISIPLKKELVYQKKENEVGISVILVADTQGSLEAISNSLPKEVKIIMKKTGEVSEADILLAKSVEGIVLSFNTKIRPEILKFSMTEKVLLRNYTIIYEMLDEIKDALEGKLQSQMEQIYGKAKVLARFPFEKTFAFGIQVNEGRIARGDRIRIIRGNDVIGETSISSLRLNKNPISKIEKGHEAGILISSPIDIQIGDMIISHS